MSKWFSDKMKRLTFFVLFALSYHNLIEHKHPEHLSIHRENVYFDIEILSRRGDQQLKKNTISM